MLSALSLQHSTTHTDFYEFSVVPTVFKLTPFSPGGRHAEPTERYLVHIVIKYIVYNNITFGVLQGSVLGPTLFLVYLNDLCDLKLENGITISYADDAALLFSAKLAQMAKTKYFHT